MELLARLCVVILVRFVGFVVRDGHEMSGAGFSHEVFNRLDVLHQLKEGVVAGDVLIDLPEIS